MRFAVLSAMLLLAVAGCGRDHLGEENTKKIIGTWKDADDGDRTYEFRVNGGYKTTSRKFGFVIEGTFKIRGNEATIKFEDKSQTVTLSKLSDDELVFQIDDERKTENRLKRVK